jgi:hypothetical protein
MAAQGGGGRQPERLNEGAGVLAEQGNGAVLRRVKRMEWE